MTNDAPNGSPQIAAQTRKVGFGVYGALKNIVCAGLPYSASPVRYPRAQQTRESKFKDVFARAYNLVGEDVSAIFLAAAIPVLRSMWNGSRAFADMQRTDLPRRRGVRLSAR